MGRGADETTPADWRAVRLALLFVLDILEISRGERDGLDALILAVISTASVATVGHDPRLEHAYATVEAPPPDPLRRPISISAVARSLGLPFETVRRRVARLVAEGLCETTPDGVVQTAAAVTEAAYLAQAKARYTRLRQFYFDLRAVDALPRPANPSAQPPAFPGPPVRIANRAIAEYMLRLTDTLRLRIGSPLGGHILLAVARANGEHLDQMSFDAAAPLPEAARRPVRVPVLAERLRMPRETVRRHLDALVGQGLLRREGPGYVLAAREIIPSGAAQAAGDSSADLKRMFERLEQLGVLHWWEQEVA